MSVFRDAAITCAVGDWQNVVCAEWSTAFNTDPDDRSTGGILSYASKIHWSPEFGGRWYFNGSPHTVAETTIHSYFRIYDVTTNTANDMPVLDYQAGANPHQDGGVAINPARREIWIRERNGQQVILGTFDHENLGDFITGDWVADGSHDVPASGGNSYRSALEFFPERNEYWYLDVSPGIHAKIWSWNPEVDSSWQPRDSDVLLEGDVDSIGVQDGPYLLYHPKLKKMILGGGISGGGSSNLKTYIYDTSASRTPLDDCPAGLIFEQGAIGAADPCSNEYVFWYDNGSHDSITTITLDPTASIGNQWTIRDNLSANVPYPLAFDDPGTFGTLATCVCGPCPEMGVIGIFTYNAIWIYKHTANTRAQDGVGISDVVDLAGITRDPLQFVDDSQLNYSWDSGLPPLTAKMQEIFGSGVVNHSIGNDWNTSSGNCLAAWSYGENFHIPRIEDGMLVTRFYGADHTAGTAGALQQLGYYIGNIWDWPRSGTMPYISESSPNGRVLYQLIRIRTNLTRISTDFHTYSLAATGCSLSGDRITGSVFSGDFTSFNSGMVGKLLANNGILYTITSYVSGTQVDVNPTPDPDLFSSVCYVEGTQGTAVKHYITYGESPNGGSSGGLECTGGSCNGVTTSANGPYPIGYGGSGSDAYALNSATALTADTDQWLLRRIEVMESGPSNRVTEWLNGELCFDEFGAGFDTSGSQGNGIAQFQLLSFTTRLDPTVEYGTCEYKVGPCIWSTQPLPFTLNMEGSAPAPTSPLCLPWQFRN